MRRHPILALLVLVPVLSLLASCGASGGKEAAGGDAKATTTAAASDDDGTDEPTDETTTTAEDGDKGDKGNKGGKVTSADLADILPTVDDVPDGYTVSEEDLTDEKESSDDGSDDSSSDSTDQAIYDACPGAEFLETLDSGTASPSEVSRNFETDAQQTIEVALDPEVGEFTEDTANKIVDALSDCDDISTTDEDGSKITMKISADPSDYGDYGIEMTMDASFDFMGTTLDIEFRGVVFSVDGTLVSVIASSGLDEATFELVPGDYDTVPELASMLEEQVASL